VIASFFAQFGRQIDFFSLFFYFSASS